MTAAVPNTRNPFETGTFVVPQPIPAENPVTTTSLLVVIAFSSGPASHLSTLASIKKIELSNRIGTEQVVDTADR